MTWIIAGGGTGGHVTPALAVGEALRARGETPVFVGTDRGIEQRLVPEAGFELVTLPSRPFVGKTVLERVTALVALAITSLRALPILWSRKCRIVIAVGGYASLPAAVAAWLLRRPVVLLNPDAEPGLANRTLSRIATRVFAAFPGSEGHFARPERVRITGIPLRPALLESLSSGAPPERDGRRHLFAFGGSLGSQQINAALLGAAAVLDPSRVRIVHQTGEAERERVAAAWREAGFDAEVVAFERDMPGRYRWADLVVCRAGAISVAELALAGRPAVLIPLAHVGGGEQAANARALERAGAAIVFDGAGFAQADFNDALGALVEDDARLAKMAKAAAGLGRPDATRDVLDACAELLAKGVR